MTNVNPLSIHTDLISVSYCKFFKISETILKVLRFFPTSLLIIALLCSCGHISSKKSTNSQKVKKTTVAQATDISYAQDTETSGNNLESDSTEATGGFSTQSDEIEESEGVAIEQEELADKKGQSLLDEALDFCEVAQSFWQKGELENAFCAVRPPGHHARNEQSHGILLL